MKRLLKQVGKGLYAGNLYGSQVTVERILVGPEAGFYLIQIKDGRYPNMHYAWSHYWTKKKPVHRTVESAFKWLRQVWGNEPVLTRNILNPKAGEFPIARSLAGTCCDPGTERYHCM